jgi:hypothetical protein
MKSATTELRTSSKQAGGKTLQVNKETQSIKNLSRVRGMSRLTKVAVALGGVGLAAVIAAGPAFADTPATTTVHNGPSAAQTGKGTQVTQYKAAYNDVYGFGWVSCAGVHQVKSSGTTENFTCTSTSGHLQGVSGGQTITWGAGQWLSDFNQAPATSFTATVSADGMSYTAVATY